MTKFIFSVLLWTASSALSCPINSIFEVQLQKSTQFRVQNCQGSTWTAVEVSPEDRRRPLQIIFEAGRYSQATPVRFIRKLQEGDFLASAEGIWFRQSSEIVLTPPKRECPPGHHWDPNLEECIPHPSEPPTSCEQTGPQSCSEGCEWHEDHNMCMPKSDAKNRLDFHLTQFVVGHTATGPRGRNAVSGPGFWMIDFTRNISPKHDFKITWMGTAEKFLMPRSGYPLLLQTGESNARGEAYIDAQHPHTTPVIGLTFADILRLGANGQHKLTFFFAPRGEATVGPENFMHRPSAEGNPDAPIAHHLQDVFHITSTVIGFRYQIRGTTIEASVFSGVEPSPDEIRLDMHKPDSYGFRVQQTIHPNVSVGGSVAKLKATHRGHDGEFGHAEEQISLSSWVSTQHMIKKGTLSTYSIWGHLRDLNHGDKLNSFLEEFVYRLGKNSFFGRVEFVQRTPEQLEILITDGSTGAKWVKPVTLGYERQIFSKENLKLYMGGSVTKNYLPHQFQNAYGGNPKSARVFVRVGWGKSKSWK